MSAGGDGQESVVPALESTEDSGLFTAVQRDSLKLLSCVDGRKHQGYTCAEAGTSRPNESRDRFHRVRVTRVAARPSTKLSVRATVQIGACR